MTRITLQIWFKNKNGLPTVSKDFDILHHKLAERRPDGTMMGVEGVALEIAEQAGKRLYTVLEKPKNDVERQMLAYYAAIINKEQAERLLMESFQAELDRQINAGDFSTASAVIADLPGPMFIDRACAKDQLDQAKLKAAKLIESGRQA